MTCTWTADACPFAASRASRSCTMQGSTIPSSLDKFLSWWRIEESWALQWWPLDRRAWQGKANFSSLAGTVEPRGSKHVKRLKAWSRFLSLVITSIIFGLGHAHGGWGYVLVATIAGFVYGYVFLYQQSLFGVIILHAVVDTIAFCFFHAIANS